MKRLQGSWVGLAALVFMVGLIVVGQAQVMVGGIPGAGVVQAQGSCPPSVVIGCNLVSSLSGGAVWRVENTGTGINTRAIAASVNASDAVAVNAYNGNTGGVGIAIRGTTSAYQGIGVLGSATYSGSGGAYGVQGGSNTPGGIGVGAYYYPSSGYGQALTAYSYSPTAYSGFFAGGAGVYISGNLSVLNGTKNFIMDHPLDPANKYLYHAAIEAPDMINVYSGNATTNASGEVVVALPKYFEAINKDFRYQLTSVGQFAQAIVSSKIKNNQFTIKTDKPNVEVSWQVMGIRNDSYAQKHPFQAEVDKPEEARGKYLYPEGYNQSEAKGEYYEQQRIRDQQRTSQTKTAAP